MKRVKCKSGIEGWQDKLQNVYDSWENFNDFASTWGIHKRLGYHSAKDAWEVNPTIQGSTDPSDLCVVVGKLTQHEKRVLEEVKRRIKEFKKGDKTQSMIYLGYPSEVKTLISKNILTPYSTETKRVLNWYNLSFYS